ncbi:hypothetical protein LIER_09520 [Lithospermum erythrorhizon]|uniref:Uncharacterized protein n=1 Tax=Lithospermum erythrorhizon TaxID=34254 RepID=A0AAV3PH56_LITER
MHKIFRDRRRGGGDMKTVYGVGLINAMLAPSDRASEGGGKGNEGLGFIVGGGVGGARSWLWTRDGCRGSSRKVYDGDGVVLDIANGN